jgi:GDP-L-fucose synthase
MIILVTGGNGLVGRNLNEYVKRLNNKEKKWVFVSSKEADLTILEQVDKLFNLIKPTHVINLAAYVGGLYKNMRENVEFFENNMLINMNIMKCCYKYNIVKLLSLLSTCIYPDNIELPITEDKLHNGQPHSSNIGYSFSKRMVEVLSTCYNQQYNTNYICLIPGNLYGPHDNFNLEDGHVVPALIHKTHIAKRDKTDLIINGTGKAYRQFTYVKDFVKLLVWALDNYNDKEPLILSNDEEVSIYDLVNIINRHIYFTGTLKLDITKSDGQIKKTISNDKFKNLYPNFKFTSLEEGIKETIRWFYDNYNYIRK